MDCPIRGEARGSEAGGPRPGRYTEGKDGGSFTGGPNGAVVLHHALPTPDSRQNHRAPAAQS